jgi:hypothetical protein
MGAKLSLVDISTNKEGAHTFVSSVTKVKPVSFPI